MMTSLDISAKIDFQLIRKSLKLRSKKRGGKKRRKGSCGPFVSSYNGEYLLWENSWPYKILHEATSQESDVPQSRWPGTMFKTCDRRAPIIDQEYVNTYTSTDAHTRPRHLAYVCLVPFTTISVRGSPCVKAGASVWHVAGESCGAALRERVIYNCYRETY